MQTRLMDEKTMSLLDENTRLKEQIKQATLSQQSMLLQRECDDLEEMQQELLEQKIQLLQEENLHKAEAKRVLEEAEAAQQRVAAEHAALLEADSSIAEARMKLTEATSAAAAAEQMRVGAGTQAPAKPSTQGSPAPTVPSTGQAPLWHQYLDAAPLPQVVPAYSPSSSEKAFDGVQKTLDEKVVEPQQKAEQDQEVQLEAEQEMQLETEQEMQLNARNAVEQELLDAEALRMATEDELELAEKKIQEENMMLELKLEEQRAERELLLAKLRTDIINGEQNLEQTYLDLQALELLIEEGESSRRKNAAEMLPMELARMEGNMMAAAGDNYRAFRQQRLQDSTFAAGHLSPALMSGLLGPYSTAGMARSAGRPGTHAFHVHPGMMNAMY